MAKKVKSVEVKANSRQLKHAFHLAGILAFVFLLAYGIVFSRRYADKTVLTPKSPPSVVLLNPPTWMNEALRQRIEQVATPVVQRSSLDASVVREVADSLAADPWVRRVKSVRRVYGKGPGDTLEVDCDYRAPIALVQDAGVFWMVDADGVKLPDKYLKSELAEVAMGKGLEGIQLRIISGVRAQAPQPGEAWPGNDLAAGIELAKLFYDKPFLNDIAMIDVSAIDPTTIPEGRRRNEVVLHTKYNTQIRWGEPIAHSAFSVDVPVGMKLKTLERLWERHGRLDAGYPWLEIRYDSVLYPGNESQSATTNTP